MSYTRGQRVMTPKGAGKIVWHFPAPTFPEREAYTVKLRNRKYGALARPFYVGELRAMA